MTTPALHIPSEPVVKTLDNGYHSVVVECSCGLRVGGIDEQTARSEFAGHESYFSSGQAEKDRRLMEKVRLASA